MSRFLSALVLATLLPLTAQAGEHRSAVMDLLNGIEQPATQADLDAIGEEVSAELLEIAEDGEVPTSRRGRAISALGYYPSEEIQTWLLAKAKEADKSVFRRKALMALGQAYGEESIDWVSPYLTDKDEQVRMAAARTLGRIGGEKATAALEARKKKEKTDAVVEVIDKALAGELEVSK